jgi:predicted SAM-dependent methyltransferase
MRGLPIDRTHPHDPAMATALESAEPRRVLHVGCGDATLQNMPDGFQDGSWAEVRFDIDPTMKPDIIGTITNMSGVADNSVDAVYSSHNIEHVFEHEVDIVLREFLRVIKPDGFVIVTCPDLQTIAEAVADDRLTTPLYNSPAGPISAHDIFYGHGASIERGFTYMAHKCGFTETTLRSHAHAAGFSMIGTRRRKRQLDLWLVGTKRRIDDQDVRALMDLYIRPY